MKRNQPAAVRLTLTLVTLGMLFVFGGAGRLIGTTPAAAQTLPTATTRPTESLSLTATVQPTAISGEGTPVTPGVPTTVTSGGGACEAIITGDDITAPGTVDLSEAELADLPNRDPRYTYIRVCELIYTDSNGQIIPNYPFGGSVEVCFPYSADDVARAGGDPARLTVLYYDPVSQQWIELEVIIDEANGRICGLAPQSGLLALAISGQVAALPNTSGNLADPTPVAAAPQAAAPAEPAPEAAAAPQAAAPTAPAAGAAAPEAVAASEPAPESAAAAAAAPAAAANAAEVAALLRESESDAAGDRSAILGIGLGIILVLGLLFLALRRNMLPRNRSE